MRVTANLRAFLPMILQACEIRRLIDAPCGDGNWIGETDLTGIEYMGIDLCRAHLARAIGRDPRAGCAPKAQMFTLADIETANFPPIDAVMCRDFFQHLRTDAVLKILAKLERSRVKWLLATSFDNEKNEEIGPEGFRPLNLQAEPFNLAKPEHAIEDPPGSGRILGAWRLC